LLLVTIKNSSISNPQDQNESKAFSVEAGFLSGWFSANTHQDLSTCATDWGQATQYLVGAKSHIEQIQADFIAKGMRTSAILAKL